MISIFHIIKIYPKLVKMPLEFIKILSFLQCAQNTKQFISVDSPSWVEQNSIKDFVIACTVVEILTIEALVLVFKTNKIGFEDQCKYFKRSRA